MFEDTLMESERKLLEEIRYDVKTLCADIGMCLNALHALATRVQANELEEAIAEHIRERTRLMALRGAENHQGAE